MDPSSGRDDGEEGGDADLVADERHEQLSSKMHDALTKYFGYSKFRGRQEEVIRTVLAGEKRSLDSRLHRAFA